MGLDRKKKEGDLPLFLLIRRCLALGELEALASALLSVLLALLGARVAGQKASLLELLAQFAVELTERPGDPVTHRASLSGTSTARDIDQHVEPGERIGQLERLPDDHPQRLILEIVVDRSSIDFELTAPFAKIDASGSTFPTTGSVIL